MWDISYQVHVPYRNTVQSSRGEAPQSWRRRSNEQWGVKSQSRTFPVVKLEGRSDLYSYKRLSWWWWCVCHPSFLTIRSASNGCEVSCGIFATIAHFSAPICRKPLIILKATTSLPHLIKTAREIYFEWKVLPPFLNICLSRDFNKWLHTEQNEWIYTSKYVYIIRMR